MKIIPYHRHKDALPEIDVYSIDFESFYSSEVSVASMSYTQYVNHPEFDAYLVSIAGPNEFKWVGNPKDFDWRSIAGKIWVSHNTPFDSAVFRRLIELGIIPADALPYYHGNSADLAVYLRLPRALAGAMQARYKITRSKDIRNNAMKGKRWQDMSSELQEKVKLYALDDAADCRMLWVDNISQWPDHERYISDLMAERCRNGIYMNSESLEDDMRFLNKIIFDAASQVPWRDDGPILSHKWLGIKCREVGIDPPKSLAMDDELCAAWEEQYGDKYPWIKAMRTWRRANTVLKKLEAFKNRTREDGYLEFSLFYSGAHTGRSSGAGGLNLLNMARAPYLFSGDGHMLAKKDDIALATEQLKKTGAYPVGMRAIDIRSKLVPSPGNHFIAGDLAQIEARVLRWLAGDHKTIAMIETGMSPYDAHARRFMGFTGGNLKKENPAGYQLAKARELALGFGVGFMKFLAMCPMYITEDYIREIFGAPVTHANTEEFLWYINEYYPARQKAEYLRRYHAGDEYTKRSFVNAWMNVMDFRKQNPEITSFWKRLNEEIKRSIGENYEIEMPSGRSLHYFNVSMIDGQVQARVQRGGEFSSYHGGLLAENVTQALARDVFIEAQIRIADAGHHTVLDVYDEALVDAPLSVKPEDIRKLMCERPSWAKSLPVDAECDSLLYYKK